MTIRWCLASCSEQKKHRLFAFIRCHGPGPRRHLLGDVEPGHTRTSTGRPQQLGEVEQLSRQRAQLSREVAPDQRRVCQVKVAIAIYIAPRNAFSMVSFRRLPGSSNFEQSADVKMDPVWLTIVANSKKRPPAQIEAE